VHYPLGEAFIAPGDTLVLFTDGVTEADAGDGSLFGIDRLSTVLREAPDGEPHALVREIVDAVAAHASDFHASDDLTVMAVSLSLPEVTARSEAGVPHWLIVTEVSSAGRALTQQCLRAILTARGVDPGRIGDADLIAEELLTNLVRAARSQPGDIQLSLECALTPGEIILTVRDSGPAFDPLAHAGPKFDAGIADREVGGLGIFIVRQLAHSCRYSRIDGCNVLDIRLSRVADSHGVDHT
jgi:sigma-B regulation protein RsbU (phosphoserine phosphatase)